MTALTPKAVIDYVQLGQWPTNSNLHTARIRNRKLFQFPRLQFGGLSKFFGKNFNIRRIKVDSMSIAFRGNPSCFYLRQMYACAQFIMQNSIALMLIVGSDVKPKALVKALTEIKICARYYRNG